MLHKSSNPISLASWLVGVLFLVVCAFWYPKWTMGGSEAVLSWDVFGYYLYLPSFFIYDDLSGVGFLNELMGQYHPASFNYHAIALDNGNFVMKYSMGQSVFYLPWFFIGHLWAKLSSYPADGLSYPYQASIFWGAMCYAIGGLWLMRKILLGYFSDKAVAVSLMLLIIATNYLNYVSFDGAMTHNHLFTMYAALLYLTISWHKWPTLVKGIIIGFLCGLAGLTRPTEVICVILPLLWGVYNKETLLHKWQLIKQHWPHMAAAVLVTGLIGSLQLIYWKTVSGHWLVYSYEDQGFSFLHPHLINGLVSFKKGWLVYTPVMFFAILGLIPLYRNYKGVFWAVAVFSAINIYITFSWDIWWYGGSFGARAMVQSYAVWLIPFAAFWQWALAAKLRWMPLVPVIAVCIWLNLFQTYNCHVPNGLMYSEGLTYKYWVEVFVKQHHGKYMRKYIDLPFEAPDDEDLAEKVMLTKLIPTDTINGFGDKKLILSDKDSNNFIVHGAALPANTNDDWVRATGKFYYRDMEWDEWKMARLGLRLYKDGKEFYYNSTRVQWLFEQNEWQQIEVDIPLSFKREGADSVAFFVENPGKPVYADTITLEFLKVK